jgi:hypothetical protein
MTAKLSQMLAVNKHTRDINYYYYKPNFISPFLCLSQFLFIASQSNLHFINCTVIAFKYVRCAHGNG